jgi:hypothetical protein
MSRKPGSIRPKKKLPTFGVTKKQERKTADFVPPVENVPEAVQEHTKVVYCNLSDCLFNQSVENLTHTETVVRRQNVKGSNWTPLSPQMEKVWTAVCTRDEVVIDLRTVKGVGGSSQRLPSCHTPWELGRSGHVDMSKRMGESYSIDDSTDPTAKDEGWIMDNSPFGGQSLS